MYISCQSGRSIAKGESVPCPVDDDGRFTEVSVNLDVRLPGKGNSDSHGARSVHLIITMIKWIRTSRLSINSLSSRRT